MSDQEDALPALPRAKALYGPNLDSLLVLYTADQMQSYARAALAARDAAQGDARDERKAFEAWDKPLSQPRDHDKNGRGEYIDDGTQGRWDAWQARAAMEKGNG